MAFFEDLEIWRSARTLTLSIYHMMDSVRDYGFRDQIQRASVSVMNNIAEGSEAGTPSLNIRFLHIAKGSCAEVRSMLFLCIDLGYCSQEKGEELIVQVRGITAGINNFIRYMEKRAGKTSENLSTYQPIN